LEASEMKNARVALIVGTALVVLGAGCSKDEEKVDSAFDPTGVAECDAYFKAAEACVRKNPTMKDAMEPTMQEHHETWKKYASTKQGKESLQTTCKAATLALAASCK
jgi:hypothetical protein